MPEIAATKDTASMTQAAPHAIMPHGGQNRRAARMQAAALRWLVRLAALLTAAVLVFLIGYILVMGIPNLKPELFAWEYNSDNVSLTPALINTVLMTGFALLIATPLGIFAAIWLVACARRGGRRGSVILATGRSVGETAALIYTASSVPKIAGSVFSSARTLAVHMYLLSNEGLYIGQTYGTAVVLLVLVLAINALSGLVAKKLTKK